MTSEYANLIQALGRLDEQTQQALAIARAEADRAGAPTELRDGDADAARCRDQVLAGLERSRESLKAMGLKGLPKQQREAPVDATPSKPTAGDDARQARQRFRHLADEAMGISAQQSQAAEAHDRLAGAAARAERDERRRAEEARQRAAEAARQEAERIENERRERERLAALERKRQEREADRQQRLASVRTERDSLAAKMWHPSKKRKLQELDAAVTAIESERI
jgi:hypothetical protein